MLIIKCILFSEVTFITIISGLSDDIHSLALTAEQRCLRTKARLKVDILLVKRTEQTPPPQQISARSQQGMLTPDWTQA